MTNNPASPTPAQQRSRVRIFPLAIGIAGILVALWGLIGDVDLITAHSVWLLIPVGAIIGLGLVVSGFRKR